LALDDFPADADVDDAAAAGPPAAVARAVRVMTLILKTRPEMHTKNCVLEKSSLNPLNFAK
jgi:hypothetical protein